VFAIDSGYIVRRAHDIETAFLTDGDGGFIHFRSCLFPMLKQCEDAYQLCANCGAPGHRSNTCRIRTCARCKRRGHLAGNCFARRALDGSEL
jgi:hypothetical protein